MGEPILAQCADSFVVVGMFDVLPWIIQEKCGILPGLQKLAYAGKNFEDSNRTLEQCVKPPEMCHPLVVKSTLDF